MKSNTSWKIVFERLRLVGKLLEAHRFNARPCFDLEMMQEMGFLC